VKRLPVFCLLESMESIIRMRIRVPAGTVILLLLCAAEFAVIAGSAEGPAIQDPSPEFGYAVTIPRAKLPSR